MDYTIGSKYEQNVAMLREGIANGTISALEAEATNNSCYFTGKPIVGTMREVVIKELVSGIEAEERYFLCDVCYQSCSPNNERLGQHVEGNFTIN